MKTWVWQADGSLTLEEQPVPAAGPGEALVRLRSAAVCGTDLHILGGRFSDLAPPLTIGHEACLEVVETGSGVTRLAVGDRCALDTVIGCGACATCLVGDKHLCAAFQEIGITRQGIWQEYSVVPAANLYPIADTVSDAAITQAELLHCVLGGVDRLALRPGERAVVLGDGAAGLLYLQVLRAQGAAEVALTGAWPFRLDLARQLGADAAVDSRVHDVPTKLGERRFDVVVDAVGIPATHALVTRLARSGGRILLFGIPSEPPRLDVLDAILRDLTFFCSSNAPRVWPRVVSLLQSGTVDVERLITNQFPFDDLPSAVALAREHPERMIKSAIVSSEP